MRVFSFGGGVQSHAVLVMHRRGELYYDKFLFCNVGDDSENPATLNYIRDVTIPYCKKHGIDFDVLKKYRKDGSQDTVYSRCMRAKLSVPIPARMKNGAPGRRQCTVDLKIRVVAKWTKAHGAKPSSPATIGLGISIDEYRRMADSRIEWQRNEYPLIDRRINRLDCLRIIQEEGLPEPPKSACWFCPFHNAATWRWMRASAPDLFERAVQLEKIINEHRALMRRDEVYFTGGGLLLPEAVRLDGVPLWDESICDSGYCMI